jgi:hypothetical protein
MYYIIHRKFTILLNFIIDKIVEEIKGNKAKKNLGFMKRILTELNKKIKFIEENPEKPETDIKMEIEPEICERIKTRKLLNNRVTPPIDKNIFPRDKNPSPTNQRGYSGKRVRGY